MIKDKGRDKLHKAAILCLKDIPYPLRFLQSGSDHRASGYGYGDGPQLGIKLYYIL